MPGRPKKKRRKEQNETKKCGKLPKSGITMTCGLCHVKGHNRSGCPLKNVASFVPSSSTPNVGRPKKTTTIEVELAIERGRGKPKKNTVAAEVPSATNTTPNVGRPKKTTTVEVEPAVKRGRGIPKKNTVTNTTPIVAHETSSRVAESTKRTRGTKGGRGSGRGAGRNVGGEKVNHLLESWFNCSGSTTTPGSTAAPSSTAATRGKRKSVGTNVGGYVNHPLESWFNCSGSTVAPSSTAATRGKGKCVARTTPYKRPRAMGVGVFQAKNGFTTFNPGLPSQRIVSTGPKIIIRSADVTGDIGFKPTSTLKWKGAKALTTRRTQEVRDQVRAKARQSTNPSLPRDPWKI
ncbi:uncharacterized protein LOC132623558 isoform X2 [Lycium barbarum]|nr:uncharacterized protein LOC132623558 isoform X2 [Lycium barbarum]